MGLPRKLKNFNLFNDGNSYLGEVSEVTLPKLTLQTEDFRAGGMLAPVKIDQGMEPLEAEFTAGGFLRDVLAQWGALKHDGVMLRFAGALQRDDTGEVDAVEVVMRGRHVEIDTGASKAGEMTEFKVKSALSYYKLTWNGEVVVEIDVVNLVMNIAGTDRMSEIRTALGV